MPITITMPQLSPTMEVGTLARWLVSEGDTVASGDVLAEIETDKATMEVEAIDDGTVGRLLVAEGTENVPVNQAIALILEEGEEALEHEPGSVDVAPPPTGPASEEVDSEPETAVARDGPGKQASSGRKRAASPLARSMAQKAGLSLDDVTGSGPGGRIIKRDIEKALKTGMPAKSPVTASAWEEIRVTGMRRVIAERLQEAKQTIPHFYLSLDCDIDRLLEARREINDAGHRVSVNDFIIRALALALRDVPDANVQWGGNVIRRFAHVDLSVAVAVDGGLVTPVIRDAASRSLLDIAAAMRDLVDRARSGKLMPEEYQGGNFTLSNLGMYGIREFDAVINPPQAGILAVGAGYPRPVARDGALAVATLMSTTLSADHRVVDGATGAALLNTFRNFVESPISLLL